MAARRRDQVQDAFTSGRSDLVMATSAFGLGIDRADVHFVVCAVPPPSLEAYYQEVGGAGRTGEPATALLVHRSEDFALGRYLKAGGGARPETLRAVIEEAVRRDGALTRAELAEDAGLTQRMVASAVATLLQVRAVAEDGHRGRLRWRGESSSADDVIACIREQHHRRGGPTRRAWRGPHVCGHARLPPAAAAGAARREHPQGCGRLDNGDVRRAGIRHARAARAARAARKRGVAAAGTG
jgi:ATP-dependent DNA helicase RecQ